MPVSGHVHVDTQQRGVGHGGFHTTEIRTCHRGDPLVINYVYDCGSRAWRTRLSPQITKYVDELKWRHVTVLDYIYISHFDADHVNGLPELSRELRSAGITVKKVVAPLLSTMQRVVVALLNVPGLGSWYDDLLRDPLQELSDLFDGADIEFLPPSNSPDDGDPEDDEPQDPSQEERGQPHVQVGPSRGRVAVSVPATHSSTSSGHPVTRELWEIVPYVEKDVENTSRNFWDEARKKIPGLSTAVSPTAADIETLLTAHRADSRDLALQLLGSDGSNFSSMSLYSGPVVDHVAPPVIYGTLYRKGWTRHVAPGSTGAWLGTGDARLESRPRVDRLTTYLRADRLDKVAVVAAPHHGSQANSDIDFWQSFPNSRLATIHSNGRSPHPGVRVTALIHTYSMTDCLVKEKVDDLHFARVFAF